MTLSRGQETAALREATWLDLAQTPLLGSTQQEASQATHMGWTALRCRELPLDRATTSAIRSRAQFCLLEHDPAGCGSPGAIRRVPPPTLDSSASPSPAAAQGHPACPCSELPFPREMKVLSKVIRSFPVKVNSRGHRTNKTEGPPSSQKPDGTAWRSSPALWHLTQSPQASLRA